jgi:hypothetical protein
MGGYCLCHVCFLVGWALEHRHFCGRFLVELGYHQSSLFPHH